MLLRLLLGGEVREGSTRREREGHAGREKREERKRYGEPAHKPEPFREVARPLIALRQCASPAGSATARLIRIQTTSP